jgi:hypothetical protein
LRQAKETKSYEDFGLLAEKISEDDFRVNMGDHKIMTAREAAAAGHQGVCWRCNPDRSLD